MKFTKTFLMLLVIAFTESCVKFESDEGINETKSNDLVIETKNKKKKIFKHQEVVVHDFTVRQEVKIPPKKLTIKQFLMSF